MSRLSHLDEKGRAAMVDVSAKAETDRIAVAEAILRMAPATLKLILEGAAPKGDVLAAARIAGIMAAKRTADLIPLCHPLPLAQVTVEIAPQGDDALTVTATAKITGKTGVEMEALTAASIAALTLYDMVKSADRGMVVERIRLLHKSGGASGTFEAGPA